MKSELTYYAESGLIDLQCYLRQFDWGDHLGALHWAGSYRWSREMQDLVMARELEIRRRKS